MKQNLLTTSVLLAAISSAAAQGLYHQGTDTTKSVPLTFTVGAQLIYDDNIAPGLATKDSSLAFNPYVGASLIAITPQTTWNVYVRLGLVYLFDATAGIDEVTSQSRAGVNFTHRFSERLRFTSENFLAYELEPDFANGIGGNRSLGAFISWSTNNSVGYRWTERFGNYVGFSLNGVDYDSDLFFNDRFTWEVYNQFRYQLGPQTVLTGDYRYGQTTGDGVASDSTNQFLLVGVEQRFSPNTIGIARVGVQMRDVDNGASETSPYAELALNTAVNNAFSLRAFTRYGLESGDTVRFVGAPLIEFDQRQTLRVGIAGDYVLSQALSLFGGIDYVPTTFAGGRNTTGASYTGGDKDEDIFNAFVGLSLKVTETVTANVSYNFTDSSSDFANQTFQRNRISIGVSAQF